MSRGFLCFLRCAPTDPTSPHEIQSKPLLLGPTLFLDTRLQVPQRPTPTSTGLDTFLVIALRSPPSPFNLVTFPSRRHRSMRLMHMLAPAHTRPAPSRPVHSRAMHSHALSEFETLQPPAHLRRCGFLARLPLDSMFAPGAIKTMPNMTSNHVELRGERRREQASLPG